MVRLIPQQTMIKTNWLKTAVITANAPKESIIATVLKNLGGAEKGRAREVLHASDVTKPDFCPRREALLDLAGSKWGHHAFLSPAQEITYLMGKTTAKLLLEQWAGSASIGNWRCRRCGDQRTMTSKPLNGCGKVQFGLSADCQWEYEEVVIDSPLSGISGSLDAFFEVGAPKLLVTEIKTVNAEDFQEIVVPLPEHRIRTNLYLKLIAESNWVYKDRINLHEAAVFYVSRGHGKKNVDHGNKIIPFKEYKVTRNDEALFPILQKARQLKVFRDTTTMPSGICATAMDHYAKSCSFCKECFSGDRPAEQEALIKC